MEGEGGETIIWRSLYLGMHIKVHGLGANLKQQARGRVSKQTRPKIEKAPLNLHSYGLDLVWGARRSATSLVSLSKSLIPFETVPFPPNYEFSWDACLKYQRSVVCEHVLKIRSIILDYLSCWHTWLVTCCSACVRNGSLETQTGRGGGIPKSNVASLFIFCQGEAELSPPEWHAWRFCSDNQS